MDEAGSDSDYSDSSGSVTSTSSSSSSADGTAVELAKISKYKLQLPKSLCENAEIFQEFFSIETWRDLPDNFQAYLKNKFLPSFPEKNELEQERTLKMLFNNEIKRFNASPLIDLQKNLEEGSYRPDVLKLRQSIERSRRREQRFQECERLSRLSKSLMISREKLLRSAYDAPPGTVLRVDRIVNAAPKMSQTAAAVRAQKRFFEEVLHITNSMGLSDLSDDETSVDNDVLNTVKQTTETQASPSNETKIVGTMCRKTRKNRSPSSTINNLMALNENTLRQILITHKKRKLEEPDRPEYETNDIRLRDVHARTQMTGTYRKSLSSGKTNGRKSHTKTKQDNDELIDVTHPSEVSANNLISNQTTTQQQQQPIMKSQMVLIGQQNTPKPDLSNSESEDDSSINVESIVLPCPRSAHPVEEIPKKRHNPQMSVAKGAKKIILNVNGTAVPEQISNVGSINAITTDYPTDTMPSTIPLSQYHGKVKAATLSDLEGIDMMHLPVDLDESGHIDILGDIKADTSNSAGPELMQETHACFLSLIRDIFCSTPNHRMKLEELKAKICAWLLNPITALNDWYSHADNWLALIPSAMHFLAGEFLDQPEDFVPYLEFKMQMNIYQWIGAGRDSDQHLIQLCNYWLSRRNEMGNKPLQKFELSSRKSAEFDESLLNERPISPPPPRCPTVWAVQPSTNEEVSEFRIQERQRFENPHRAFTYRMHGYESVVGPVKGIYTQILQLTKARGHNMLTADRPNFVTILTLVRDATARLPNGEGTRADICELLKSSQYINTQAQESILQTIVSGALDRMHTEHDPCVRYDPKRKIWIYLHRNRTEEEFERLHQQFQGVGKNKKPANRKVKQKPTKILQPSLLSPDGSSSVPVVVVPSATSAVMPKLLPALSSIQQSSALQITNTVSSTNPPPLKIPPPKVLVKPELVPLKPLTQTNEKLETVDSEMSFDTHTTSVILPKTAQTLQTLPTLLGENKMQKLTSKKSTMQNSSAITQPTTTAQIKVSTPTGIQTVHVSAASISVSAVNSEQKQITSILATSPMGQSILSSQSQLVMSNKKIAKPILFNQSQTPSLVSQATPSSQGYIIPINLNNSEQLKAIPSISSTIIATSNLSPKVVKSSQPPALTSTVNTKQTLTQQPNRNFVRVASTVAQAGKSLISPHIAATNITLQQQQKLLCNANTSNISLQHQKVPAVAATGTINIRPQQKLPLVNSTATIKTHQSLTPVQQKQIFQNIISQHNNKNNIQRTNALNISQNTVVIPSGQLVAQQQGIQAKQVIISSQGNVQQQLQKFIVSSAAGSLQTSTIAGNSGGPVTSHSSGLISPQIIQIHQTGPGSGTKVQTLNTSNLTPQQQQNLLQSIKQQQKIQQSQSSNQQQSLIIKQQPIFHQIQKQVNASTSTVISATAASSSGPKTVSSVLGSNIIGTTNAIGASTVLQHQTQNVAKHQTILQQQNIGKQIGMGNQPQTVTRVIKSVASIIHPQVISSVSGVRTQAGNPVMAKVLTNSSGQIISLESLLQKQGVSPGTALRVTGTKPNQTSLIQLAGTPGSQLTQYAVVSQSRNLISVGAPQRMITTQASNTNTIVTSLGKINEYKTTSALNAGTIQPHMQNQTKVITANQIHPIAAQQLMNAKLLGKAGAGGIRMVNASNLNIAHIRGKPVIIASKPANVSGQQTGQNVILQSPVNSTNLVIGGQTLKVQGNVMTPSSVQVLNQSTSQPQTVVLSNQIIKVQQANPTLKSQATTPVTSNTIGTVNNSTAAHLTTIASTNTGTMVVNSNANLNQLASKTVVLSSTGQTIRVQNPGMQVQTAASSTQGQPMILGTTVKGSTIKTTGTGQQRVVLAVQGGGQILLPPGFQGGAINLKTLQGLKVVSIAQQQNKGQSDERPPMFAQIVTAPRPPNPGGE